jgi:hypothetical protein
MGQGHTAPPAGGLAAPRRGAFGAMSPTAGGRTLADIQRQAALVGATVVSSYVDESGYLVAELDVPDVDEGKPLNTAVLLEGLMASDASVNAIPPEIVAWAKQNGPAALLSFVQQTVAYTDEETETFMSPAFVLSSGAGDCDDSARAYVAIARAAGWQARLVYFLQGGQPAHVAAQVVDPVSGAWTWAETTIAARYGEAPFAALARLGIPRADIGGTPYVIQNGRPVPLKGMGRMTTIGQASWPSYLGDGFAADLVSYSQGIGANPLDVLKLLLSESSLQPGAKNTSYFPAGQYAIGINQLAPVNWGFITNAGYTLESYAQLTAQEQLPVAFAYFQNLMSAHGLSSISGRDLYVLNFLPAYYQPNQPDSAVLVASPSGYYEANKKSLDHGGKGSITYGDMQIALNNQAHGALWDMVSAAVLQDAPTSGASVPVLGAILVLAFAAGSYFADPSYTLSFVR